MPRRVLECISFDTATASCTQQAWVERANFPELSVADAGQLLSAIALLFVAAWGWKQLSRQARSS